MLLTCDPNDKEGSSKLLEDLTTNANRVQNQILEEILIENSKTEYLRSFLNGNTDKVAFKKKVPMVEYEDIKHYIERIVNEAPAEILTSQTITELHTSSGTSGGQRKMMPVTAEDLEIKAFFSHLMSSVMKRSLDGLDEGKGMYLMFIKPEIVTPSGLIARPALTSYYKSRIFKRVCSGFTSPYETIMCLDTEQSMYCQLLCGLIQRDEVFHVGAYYASGFLQGIKFLENYWPELVSNIRTGNLSDWITDTSCRNAVMSILGRPNSELADLVEPMFKGKSWEGIVKRLWPRTKFVDSISTGSMAQYISILDFYSGGLPLVSKAYASSECYFGFNLNPLCKPSDISYTLLPYMAYFEFIPVDKNGEAEGLVGEAVDLVDVKPGKHYELVVTTFTGLYRYRVGDILMVTGFYNNAPQFRFLHRKNVILSIDMDKTNEEDLFNAVTKAKILVESLGCLVTDYTSFPNTTSIPGHYVLFWELKTMENEDLPDLEATIMEQCCNTVEDSLDYVYRRGRSKEKSIGPLEIRVVKYGTFDALMDLFVSQGSSVNQYKTPRCIKSDEALEILNARVVGNFFSKKVPTWELQT
ncbi:hypothetical protein GIB67_004054 [Kingdonia uniflora]|uniref:Indole-3-acetic acid-amido synthetase GH3.17-like n=1 Tax=Kingdonia uniflora TaxID=39325 RepID=A0A7J7NRS3_9MAGN|nr:hypothetical protein GIB67_004054 [Kingdonia uniflora]